MFKRLARIGSTPTKYQFALVLKNLTLGVNLDCEMKVLWTRGPHVCMSDASKGQNGYFEWSLDDQRKKPLMFLCTLYMEKKGDPSTNTPPKFGSKTCTIAVKQVGDDGKTKTVGSITLDLAQYALEKAHSWDFSQKLDNCTDKQARLRFSLHSRPAGASTGGNTSNAAGSSRNNDVETLSTMHGMDESYVDNDSVVDLTAIAKSKQEGTNSNNQKAKDEDDDDDDDDDNAKAMFMRPSVSSSPTNHTTDKTPIGKEKVSESPATSSNNKNNNTKHVDTKSNVSPNESHSALSAASAVLATPPVTTNNNISRNTNTPSKQPPSSALATSSSSSTPSSSSNHATVSPVSSDNSEKKTMTKSIKDGYKSSDSEDEDEDEDEAEDEDEDDDDDDRKSEGANKGKNDKEVNTKGMGGNGNKDVKSNIKSLDELPDFIDSDSDDDDDDGDSEDDNDDANKAKAIVAKKKEEQERQQKERQQREKEKLNKERLESEKAKEKEKERQTKEKQEKEEQERAKLKQKEEKLREQELKRVQEKEKEKGKEKEKEKAAKKSFFSFGKNGDSSDSSNSGSGSTSSNKKESAKDKEKAKEEIARLTQEVERLQSAYKTQVDAASSAKLEVASLTASLKATRSKCESLEEKLEGLEEEKDKLMKRVDHLTKDLESHDERANAILEEMRSEFTGKMTMYDVEMKSVKETLQNERLEHKQAMEKLATQKDEQFSRALNLSQAQVAQLTQELNQLQARHRHFGSVVGLKGTKVEQQLRAQIAYYEAQLTDADETLESVKKTYSSTNGVLMREVESLLTKLNESGQRERKSEEERKVTSAKLVAEIEKNTKQHEQFMKMTRAMSALEHRLALNEEHLLLLREEAGALRKELRRAGIVTKIPITQEPKVNNMNDHPIININRDSINDEKSERGASSMMAQTKSTDDDDGDDDDNDREEEGQEEGEKGNGSSGRSTAAVGGGKVGKQHRMKRYEHDVRATSTTTTTGIKKNKYDTDSDEPENDGVSTDGDYSEG